MRNLFNIVEVFRKELYSEQPQFNRDDISDAIANFEYAYNYFFSACQIER